MPKLERTLNDIVRGYIRRAFGHNSPAANPEADSRSEFTRIREERRAALAAFQAALDRGDTRGQCATQPAAIHATNAALRGGR